MTVIKKLVFPSFALFGLLALALAVSAQGPRGREGFGPGPGGPGSFGPPCTSGCPKYEYTFTRTITQPIFKNGKADTSTTTTTGTIASYSDGGYYRDVTMTPVVPGLSSSGPQEIIFVRDMVAKLNYIEHVGGKSGTTYEEFPIKTPPANGGNPNWNGAGPGKGPNGGSGNTVASTIALPDGTNCNTEVTTITRGDSVIHRTYCPALKLLVAEDRSDRFGQSTYVLGPSASTAPTSFPYTPPSGAKLIQRPNFGRGGPGRGGPPPSP
jgi:hypothetical protein